MTISSGSVVSESIGAPFSPSFIGAMKGTIIGASLPISIYLGLGVVDRIAKKSIIINNNGDENSIRYYSGYQDRISKEPGGSSFVGLEFALTMAWLSSITGIAGGIIGCYSSD